MSNYPAGMSRFSDDPRSPAYDVPDEEPQMFDCTECGEEVHVDNLSEEDDECAECFGTRCERVA